MVEETTPLQKARMQAAAEALATGRHHINIECEHCRSTSVHDDGERIVDHTLGWVPSLLCVTCGKRTGLEFARRDRQRRIKSFIKAGIDIPLTRIQKAKTQGRTR